MNLNQQKQLLKMVIEELVLSNIPVTGIYMPEDTIDGGIEIDFRYTLQIAPYHDPIFIVDFVEYPGEEIASFSTVPEMITFIMETHCE